MKGYDTASFFTDIIGYVFAILIASMFLRAYWGGIIGLILSIMKKNPFDTIKSEGFTKRIVVYDFLSFFIKILVSIEGFKHWYMVGIWLNYEKRLVALRLHRDSWNRIEIPFDEIQSVQIFEDDSEIYNVRGFGPFVSANTDEISKGLQIRINTGTQAYYLKLYDPLFGSKLKKSNWQYKAIQECAQRIDDEIDSII